MCEMWLVAERFCPINLILSLPYLHHWLSSFNLSFVHITSNAYPYSITGGWMRAAISPCLTYKLPPSFWKQDVTHQPTTSIIMSANQSAAYCAQWLAMLKLSLLHKGLKRVITLSHCALSAEGWFLSRRESYVMVSPTGFSPEAKNQNIPTYPHPTRYNKKRFWKIICKWWKIFRGFWFGLSSREL